MAGPASARGVKECYPPGWRRGHTGGFLSGSPSLPLVWQHSFSILSGRRQDCFRLGKEKKRERKVLTASAASLSLSPPMTLRPSVSVMDGWGLGPPGIFSFSHLRTHPSPLTPGGSRVNPCPQLLGPVLVTREVSSLLYPPWGGSLYRRGHQTGCLSEPQDYREVG